MCERIGLDAADRCTRDRASALPTHVEIKMNKHTDIQTTSIESTGGVTIVADVGGNPANPSVILLHGGGQTRHAWGGALRELIATGYHTLSVDLRGHGDSSWSTQGDYSIDSLCTDLQAVVDTLPNKPILVGASLGGVISMVAQGQNPALAAALVLVDVVPHMEPKGIHRIIDFMLGKPEGFASLEEVAAAIATYNPHRPPPSNLEGLKKNLRQREDGRWHWHWDPAFMAHGGLPHEAALEFSQHMCDAAQHIQVPTLLVRGMASDVVSLQGVAELQQLLPHLEVVDIEQTGHMVAGDRNDAFNVAVIDFLGRYFPVEATN